MEDDVRTRDDAALLDRRLLAEIKAELSDVPPALRKDYGELTRMLDAAVSERAERQALPEAIRRATARR